jgi:hypothetical protein
LEISFLVVTKEVQLEGGTKLCWYNAIGLGFLIHSDEIMIIAMDIKGISLSSPISTIQSASKSLVLMLGNQRNPNVEDMSLGCDLGHLHELIKSFGKIFRR